MELIQIPNVSLVDGLARKIGTYDDDKDWWQHIREKLRTDINGAKQTNAPKIDSPDQHIELNDLSGSRIKLIDNKHEHSAQVDKKFTFETMAKIAGYENNEQARIIGETPLHIGNFKIRFIIIVEKKKRDLMFLILLEWKQSCTTI